MIWNKFKYLYTMKEIKNENKLSQLSFGESIYHLNTKDNFNNYLPKEEEPKQKTTNMLKENLMFDFKIFFYMQTLLSYNKKI